MDLIEYKGRQYPELQSKGFASQYCFAIAEKFCKGDGLDIGYCKPEWKYPGASGVDEGKFLADSDAEIKVIDYNALNLPTGLFDYIFSSHCLEHLPNYVDALDYWNIKLKKGGILFLYLPNMDYQQYWQPENNRKHLHYISPLVMKSYFNNRLNMWKNTIVTEGYDLNGSFYVVSEKIGITNDESEYEYGSERKL